MIKQEMLKGYVCVYGASQNGVPQHFVDDARELGRLLAQNGWGCVNGAGCDGLMRAVSDGVLDHGGEAVGVIPRFMVDNGWHYDRLTRIVVTPTMHERKEKMNAMTQAAIALPGGCGTLEELLEIITWRQLGIAPKPVILLNTHDYYAHLLAMLERAMTDGFMKPSHRRLWQVATTPLQAIEMLHHELAAPAPAIESKY